MRVKERRLDRELEIRGEAVEDVSGGEVGCGWLGEEG